MNYKTLRIALQIIGSIVAIAWVVEAQTIGRGFISTYLAPFAFIPLFIGSIMFLIELRAAKSHDDKPTSQQ
jgi:hypothetical protein